MNARLHEIERILEAQAREILRAMLQAHFDLRSAQDVRALRGNDAPLPSRGAGTAQSTTLAPTFLQTWTKSRSLP
jgi:hypothetical protein